MLHSTVYNILGVLRFISMEEMTKFKFCISFFAFNIVHGLVTGVTSEQENNVTERSGSIGGNNFTYSTTYLEMALQYIDLQKDPETLLVKDMGIKGRGVITTKCIPKESFVCEYTGELLTEEEGDEREEAYQYQNDPRIYLYTFECNGKNWVIDSSEESSRVGRLINHRLKFPNVKSVSFEYKGIPRLVFIATRDIFPYEELTLDYDITDPENIKENPWLAY